MKKLPLIRHIRYLWFSFRFWTWWDMVGKYMGAVPNESDLKFLHDVWYGKR